MIDSYKYDFGRNVTKRIKQELPEKNIDYLIFHLEFSPLINLSLEHLLRV